MLALALVGELDETVLDCPFRSSRGVLVISDSLAVLQEV